jgi:UDP:flavonoid glycosyltransferase YjiC (YdhE family)
MRSYRLLFAVIGGEGHIYSALGVVAELVRRGHLVTVVTAAEYADDVAAAGARFAPPSTHPPRVGNSREHKWGIHARVDTWTRTTPRSC